MNTVASSPSEPLLCERCEKQPVSPSCEEGLYCDDCLQNMAEAAYERSQEGECFRGGEADAYFAEEQARVKREAKG